MDGGGHGGQGGRAASGRVAGAGQLEVGSAAVDDGVGSAASVTGSAGRGGRGWRGGRDGRGAAGHVGFGDSI